MNDKELLELSAKAYGIQVDYRRGSDAFYYDDDESGRERWRPLDDDGQALRLAVKLQIDIGCHKDFVGTWADQLDGSIYEDYLDDPMAATRIAIVKAAAEIGRLL